MRAHVKYVDSDDDDEICDLELTPSTALVLPMVTVEVVGSDVGLGIIV